MEERVRALNSQPVRPGARYVLYRMRAGLERKTSIAAYLREVENL